MKRKLTLATLVVVAACRTSSGPDSQTLDATPAPAAATDAGTSDLGWIIKDMTQASVADRQNYRYLTLAFYERRGLDAATIKGLKASFLFVLNSLSWLDHMYVPPTIDPAGLIYRIDLRQLSWGQTTLDVIGEAEGITRGGPPYSQIGTPAEKQQLDQLFPNHPLLMMRGDQFCALAMSTAYNDVMGLVNASSDTIASDLLEKRMGINAGQAVAKTATPGSPRLMDRIGLMTSGVSVSNRVIDRFPTSYGAYWQSYDFTIDSFDNPLKNIATCPLGPSWQMTGCPLTPPVPKAGHAPNQTKLDLIKATVAGAGADGIGFVANIGEVIFHLPNGLQGYAIFNYDAEDDTRFYVMPKGLFGFEEGYGVFAPYYIVRDTHSPARAFSVLGGVKPNDEIVTGVGCVGCHARGLIQATDDVLDQYSGPGVNPAVAAKVKALYTPTDQTNALIDQDSQKYLAALAKIPGFENPADVSAKALLAIFTDYYMTPITPASLAAELGTDKATLLNALNTAIPATATGLSLTPAVAAFAAGTGTLMRWQVEDDPIIGGNLPNQLDEQNLMEILEQKLGLVWIGFAEFINRDDPLSRQIDPFTNEFPRNSPSSGPNTQ